MEKRFDLYWVDAFTETTLAGNPCPVVFGADTLSDVEMLAITREMNQSETAFLMNSKGSHLKARYFTPEKEIPLAGHPTIASIHAAVEKGLIEIKGRETEISLELIEGPIKIVVLKENGKTKIKMFQRKPEFYETHDPSTIANLFGLNISDLHPEGQPQTVSTGTKQLMVPVRSLEVLKKLKMNVEAYRAYRAQRGFFSCHLFCTQGVTPDGHTFARHPGVPPDTHEDPFTGSSSGAMGAYLWRYNLINNPVFVAEQGHWLNRPGQCQVEVKGARDNIESVSIMGTAKTVLKGELTL